MPLFGLEMSLACACSFDIICQVALLVYLVAMHVFLQEIKLAVLKFMPPLSISLSLPPSEMNCMLVKFHSIKIANVF